MLYDGTADRERAFSCGAGEVRTRLRMHGCPRVIYPSHTAIRSGRSESELEDSEELLVLVLSSQRQGGVSLSSFLLVCMCRWWAW